MVRTLRSIFTSSLTVKALEHGRRLAPPVVWQASDVSLSVLHVGANKHPVATLDGHRLHWKSVVLTMRPTVPVHMLSFIHIHTYVACGNIPAIPAFRDYVFHRVPLLGELGAPGSCRRMKKITVKVKRFCHAETDVTHFHNLVFHGHVRRYCFPIHRNLRIRI